MEDYPTLIEGGKRCFCESRGELIYCDEDNPPHPAVANLPQPEIRELQRRPKAGGSASLQFLEQKSDLQSQNYLQQFKLTIEADGVLAALKGILLYNPYTVAMTGHLSTAYDYGHRLMPKQVSAYLSNWFHQEIAHFPTTGLITDFSWHPKTNKIAIALKDDTIKIWYGEKDNLTPLLKHKRQVGITVVSWKPLVDDILAVGCHDCCILWTVDPASLSARPGSGCAQVISSPSNQPVHSLSWDPKSSLLVLASKNSSKIEIWDSDREELILRKSGLTCVAKVVFNQSGDRLLVSGQNSLSVFQCTDWKVETWSGLEGTVEHINWSDDGDKFIFAVTNKLFCIGFDSMLGGDCEAKLIATFEHEISQLAWHNERLAISLRSEETQVMLFNTQIGPSGCLRVEFIGWIPGYEQPELLTFRGNFTGPSDFGSILSMIYKSGKIENVPLLYIHHAETDTTGVLKQQTKYETSANLELNSYTICGETNSYY